jgi:type I restriction enzyme M protein
VSSASPEIASLGSFVWSIAEILRGDYKQSEYGRVILPLTVLRRLDCVLAPTKQAVLEEFAARTKQGLNPEPFLLRKAGVGFYNTSQLDMKRLMGDQDNIASNLFTYVQAFSPPVRDIFERFNFHTRIDRLAKNGLLYMVTEKFAQTDPTPTRSATARWGWSSRNSSASSPRPRTRRRGNTSRRARSSA